MRLPFGFQLTRAAPLATPVTTGNYGGWSAWGARILEPFTGAWQRNIEWTRDTVLAHHAVYACITRISQDIGKLRPRVMEFTDDGVWTEVNHPIFTPKMLRPNHYQNSQQFQELWAISMLTHGNAYRYIVRDNRGGESAGVPRAQYLLSPEHVTVLVTPDGEVLYELKMDNVSGIREAITVPSTEIVHDRVNCIFHPLVGTSPIFACGAQANVGIQIYESSSKFFSNNATPGGLLSTVQSIPPNKAEELKDRWNKTYGTNGRGLVAVLDSGMTYTALRMTAVDSQLIEQLKWSAETVCSAFQVPSWKIGIGEQPAYTKPEIANQAYYSDCLQSYIEHFESGSDQAFRFETPTGGKQLGVELAVDEGLLRMDLASQISTLKEAVGGSLLSINDARKKLNQPPKKGGDSIWMQQQNYSIEALAERDANDPFAKPEPAPASPAPTGAEPDEEEDEDEVAAEERSASIMRMRNKVRTLKIRSWVA